MGKKALIIDDSEVVRRKYSWILEQEGFETLVARDGVEGLDLLRENPRTNIILTDIHMPRMEGIELIKTIRTEDDSIRNIPILIVSTEGAKALVEQGKAAGANAWIVKPVDPKKMVEIVRKLTATQS